MPLQLKISSRSSTRATAEMSSRILEQALPYEGLTKEKLDILFCPISSGQGLEKHHDLLKVHFDQFGRPLDEKCSANI